MENIIVKSKAALSYGGKEYRCVLGRGGVGKDKVEGDGKTPLGRFPIREVLYRADKVPTIETSLKIEALSQQDGWCDDINLDEYNKRVKLPFVGSHESLWRPDDDRYDIIVVLGYNDDPPVKGKGSAIFMHVARPAFTPTAGCVALAKEDLLEILSKVQPGTMVCVEE
jgi:L,D-peptidoglycan transpeptidase YkuD (ErfK/YbiS/YcfS/YnhG family)